MILSPGRSYLFIHIPKTGGTALALALEARAKADDIMLGDTPKARRRRHRVNDVATRGRKWKHSTLADIEGLVPEQTLRRLFVFTLVRNPWDRAVSYYHWLREQRFDHPAVHLARSLDFCDFASHPQTMAAFRGASAASYLRHRDGSQQGQLYIRLEHFSTDAQPLFDHLGFEIRLPLANTSKRQRDWRRYYDTDAAQSVAQSCAEDIAQFEYSFNDSPLSL
ncbi:sulfotransferase family 2 domain-containing protein [Parasedimentitalea psychrophila]|uniref:Sulfotransferase family 2 domain-containing protein n=1 Tax=Parasedimentitalea psychrophila TaxID=2997337 RepID=A0A9Y2P722_9RHOB|nr:sulfotransferase family 2 domain-containing protein [Parasedimentitalea psychrophila]WIY25335.1 sulfotransferase family 2 domain-containing protein [Parasedimentitalea psychrophila]